MSAAPVTVMQLVSYAAGNDGRRSTGGPERRALASLPHFDPARVRLVVCYSRLGRLWHEFAAAAERLPNVTLVEYVCDRRRDWRAFGAIRRLVRAHGVDVIHSQGPHAPDWWAAAAGAATGCATLVTRPIANEDYHLRPLDERRFAFVDRLALGRAHRLVFVSDAIRDRSMASRVGWCRGARSTVVRNGVDTARFAPGPREPGRLGIPAEVPTFGMIGQLLPVKNWDGFLAVAERVCAAVPGATGVVIGDGPERERLAAEAARRGLGGRIVFTGFCADVAPVLRQLDVFLLTSRREGLPVSILEAMATGLPTVVTDVGANRDVVVEGETGFVVAPDALDSAAAHVVALLAEPARRHAIGRAARARVEAHYALERMVAEYQALYLEAAAARRALSGRPSLRNFRSRATALWRGS